MCSRCNPKRFRTHVQTAYVVCAELGALYTTHAVLYTVLVVVENTLWTFIDLSYKLHLLKNVVHSRTRNMEAELRFHFSLDCQRGWLAWTARKTALCL